MKRSRWIWLAIIVMLILAAAYGAALIRRGFSAADEPSTEEKLMACSARRLAVPLAPRTEKSIAGQPGQPELQNLLDK